MIDILCRQIEQYQPWDNEPECWNASDRTHQAAVLALLQTGPAAFNRQVYQPGHITGSAWILAEDTGRVALIYHRRLNRWLQPGGHAEVNEFDGLSTALREAQEESGLLLDPTRASLFDLDVHGIPATATQPAHLHFDVRYLCLTEQQPLAPDSDAAQAQWFTVAELVAMDLDEGMQRMMAKGLRQLGVS